MPYPYEKLLGAKAQDFADAIQAELTYSATIDPKSHREYSVAIQLGNVGKATIFYSAKKKTYKLVTNHLDHEIAENIIKMTELATEKNINVDHIIPAGSLNTSQDLPLFVERLFCEQDNLQVLCMTCHDKKTLKEKQAKKKKI